MEINELKVGDIIKLSNLFSVSTSHPFEIGKNYFIRTVTMIQIGKLVDVTDKELVLKNAVWVADTGRFTQALLKGDLNEVELFPNNEKVIVGRGAIIDACIWKHEIPKEQK